MDFIHQLGYRSRYDRGYHSGVILNLGYHRHTIEIGPKSDRSADACSQAPAKAAKTGETNVQPTPVQALEPPASSAASGSVGVVEWPSEEDAKTTDGFGMLRKVIPFATWPPYPSSRQ